MSSARRVDSEAAPIRVGIEFPFFDRSWLGGVSAIANLVNAFEQWKPRRIELVLIAGGRTPDSLLEDLRGIEILRTNLIDPAHWSSLPGRVMRRAIGRNLHLEFWLKAQGIDIYSHGAPLGQGASLPTIGHIADFGYKYFRHLYADDVFAAKDAGTARVCNEYDVLLLSSRAVEADYRRFFPEASATSAVLNIVPTLIPNQESTLDQLIGRYGIPDRYFHSPNQFWVHKNHIAIVEALAIAKSEGHDIHVVCNGRPHDERRPDHFGMLMDRANALGVADHFHVLDIIPYQDSIDLTRHSLALVSASLFEGWGISVSEAKMLGKAIILSDIPVFREQNPERARYFAPNDYQQLATHLIAARGAYSADEDRLAAARQKANWAKLAGQYATGFEEIVLAALKMPKRAQSS
jgi:glycosyltransferase involved in cell wall biosynthesis